MSSYTKLFSSIIHSSVWQAERHVKILWITLLAMKDRDGVVEASLPGLAAAAGISMDETKQALALFQAPDPYSRTKTDDGRRVREVDGGWFVINHDLYNERSSADDYKAKNAARMARLRAAKKAAECSATSDTSSATRADVAPRVQNRAPSTPDPTLLCSADSENKDSAAMPLVSAGQASPKAPRTRKPPADMTPDEAAAWSVWCEVIGQCAPTRPPSSANLLAIRKAIAAHDVATVCDAFRGVTLSTHHMGDAAYRQPASVLRLGDARIEGHAGRWREKHGTAAAPAPYNYRDENRETPESEARYQVGVKANNERIMANLRGDTRRDARGTA
jgi:hypothetical protein